MTQIKVPEPEPEKTDYGRTQYATEVAFGSLISAAKSSGLDLQPVMGLMYLPSQELTRQFQVACQDILLALTPPPHVGTTSGTGGTTPEGDTSVT